MNVTPQQLPDVFRRNLKAIRAERGLTVRQLAEIMSSSATSVSEWETGKASPTLATICRISEALHVPPEALLTDVAEKILVPST